ncbi:hypothetical protein A0J61_02188 [Choanephora cucurbitarum]|uniref:Uncharacterized protein n=1 Tax=Choanephora cucurbitarum TaxID=101091 RepID=A0A1C7NLB6_9FUNG|nr:hypothetical protein A0J61_02188 [Choanephora cucurbitarum]
MQQNYSLKQFYPQQQSFSQQQLLSTGEKKPNLPQYGFVGQNEVSPMQREQQQLQQQIQQNKGNSKAYPGAVAGTPAESKGIQGYDAQGNPIIPAFIAQRHQIEQSLGPTCPTGGYHELRMHLTKASLFFAILIIPYCCGWRGRRECVCTKCHQKFPQITLPSAY